MQVLDVLANTLSLGSGEKTSEISATLDCVGVKQKYSTWEWTECYCVFKSCTSSHKTMFHWDAQQMCIMLDSKTQIEWEIQFCPPFYICRGSLKSMLHERRVCFLCWCIAVKQVTVKTWQQYNQQYTQPILGGGTHQTQSHPWKSAKCYGHIICTLTYLFYHLYLAVSKKKQFS